MRCAICHNDHNLRDDCPVLVGFDPDAIEQRHLTKKAMAGATFYAGHAIVDLAACAARIRLMEIEIRHLERTIALLRGQ